MNKRQWIVVGTFVALFLFLWLAFDVKPKQQRDLEQQRMQNLAITDPTILRDEAWQELDPNDKSQIQYIEQQIRSTEDSLQKLELNKELSGFWYRLQRYGLAGNVAEEIAQKTQQANHWGIAGTTFARGIAKAPTEKERLFCRQKAFECLEKAASIDPKSIDYQLNRAVLLAEYPDPNNPMKGIQILLNLNKKHPENVPIMNNLAKFALQTNQLEKAEQRLLKAVGIAPTHPMTNCLLVELYQRTGQQKKVELYKNNCK